MIENRKQWQGVRNTDPPEPLAISTVDPNGVFVSAYQTQIGIGTAIVYTVPVGNDYLYLTNYTLGLCGTATGWARLEIYNAVPALIDYIGVSCTFARVPSPMGGPIIPPIRIPPTYSIRLQVSVINLDAYVVIQGKLSSYQY